MASAGQYLLRAYPSRRPGERPGRPRSRLWSYQQALLVHLAAKKALQLAARGPGNRAGAHQHNIAGLDLVLVDDRPDHGAADLVQIGAQSAALELVHDDEPLFV